MVKEQSIFNYMVAPKGNRSTSEISVDDGKLLLNTELQNHMYTNRIGTIVNMPLVREATELKIGDEVILHHNVFRRFRDIKGIEKNSKNYYSEDIYFVQPDQIYAYKRNESWNALENYCFVKPIKETKMFSNNFERPLIGVVKFGNDVIEEDSLVGFKPGAEYEFIIDGERLYRVPINLITIKYEYQGDEEEYNPSWA
jgi:hypothetical protein